MNILATPVLLLTIMLTVFVSGCTTPGQVKKVTVVQAVAVVPTPPKTVPPVLEIDKLNAATDISDEELAKAYVASIAQLRNYVKQLDAIINKYRVLSVENKKQLEIVDRREELITAPEEPTVFNKLFRK